MMEKEKNKAVELLLSPFGLIVLASIVVLIILLVVSINSLLTRQPESEVTYEYDPASQTDIAWMPITNGDDVELPIYVGFTDIYKNGMTTMQLDVFKYAIEHYAESNDLVLERVSYLKDSYNLAASYVFDFKVVLNVDGATLKVRADSSKGWKNIIGMVVILWDEDEKELYSFKVTDENSCLFFNSCQDENLGD